MSGLAFGHVTCWIGSSYAFLNRRLSVSLGWGPFAARGCPVGECEVFQIQLGWLVMLAWEGVIRIVVSKPNFFWAIICFFALFALTVLITSAQFHPAESNGISVIAWRVFPNIANSTYPARNGSEGVGPAHSR
jgi:hypothetical protein